MVAFTPYVDVECYSPLLDPDGLVINDPDDDPINVLSGWVPITDDINNTSPLTYSSGNMNNTIIDRVADDGVLSLLFNNSESNSAGLLGYYSPDNANVRDCFGQGEPIRIRIDYNGTTYYQWRGQILTVNPIAGMYGERKTIVEAVDYIHYFLETEFLNTNIQLNKSDDELIASLVSLLPRAPENTDYDIGNDEYAYAFHDETNGISYLDTILQKMMMSGLGKIFVRGGTTYSETLTYINRANILNPGSAVAALDDNMIGLDVIRDESSLIKTIKVTTYPVEIDTSNVVLWQLNNEIAIDPGTSKTFTMYLRDPNGRATKVAAYSLVTPVAGTDFNFSSVSGSGSDLNASLGIAISNGTSVFEVTVTNNAAVTGYLWLFKPRGKGVYIYEPITIVEPTGNTSGGTINVNMIYQEDVNVGRDIATILADWYTVPRSNINSVKFIANTSDELMTAALVVQPGDYVTIKETVTGIDTGFIVNGIEKEIRSGNIMYVTWALCQAQIVPMFILDVSQLDVDVLGV